jgi:hypothetical protein
MCDKQTTRHPEALFRTGQARSEPSDRPPENMNAPISTRAKIECLTGADFSVNRKIDREQGFVGRNP